MPKEQKPSPKKRTVIENINVCSRCGGDRIDLEFELNLVVKPEVTKEEIELATCRLLETMEKDTCISAMQAIHDGAEECANIVGIEAALDSYKGYYYQVTWQLEDTEPENYIIDKSLNRVKVKFFMCNNCWDETHRMSYGELDEGDYPWHVDGDRSLFKVKLLYELRKNRAIISYK